MTNSLLGVPSATTGGQTTDYIVDPNGRVLGQKDPDGKRYSYLRDRLGSTIGVVNQSGERVNDYWYDPYGDYQGGKNPDPAAGIPLVNWRYTGEWLDTTNATTGVYKIGLRYYDTGTKRWTQTDPAERITNPGQPAETQPYTYAGCNPTNHSDPTGASVAGCIGGIFIMTGGLITFGEGVLLAPPSLGTSLGLVAGGLTIIGTGIITAEQCWDA